MLPGDWVYEMLHEQQWLQLLVQQQYVKAKEWAEYCHLKITLLQSVHWIYAATSRMCETNSFHLLCISGAIQAES